MNENFDHEFDYRTYLELKISIKAFDCLNITSTSLLGCSFVPKQGPWSLILDHWSLILDPRSLNLDLWSIILDPWSLIGFTFYLISRIREKGSRIRDQGSRIKDRGSRIKDQGSRIGSRIKDHGPCFGTNEHPRRDTDVILRLSKSTTDDQSF